MKILLAKSLISKHLNWEIDKEKKFWEQAERVNWLKSGDRNASFCHRCTSQRRNTDLIKLLEYEDGRLTADQDSMAQIAKSYFVDLFSSKLGLNDMSHILFGVDRTIINVDNTELMVAFIEEKLHVAVKEMGPTKALGIDNFSTIFYQKYWHIEGKEVSLFCLGVLNGEVTLDALNIKSIVLILKIPNSTKMVNFHSINLCNVLYKIIVKTIANHFCRVLDKCIDKAQSTFVSGRLITDNVLLTYELLHTFVQKRGGWKGLMALKLDMSKA